MTGGEPVDLTSVDEALRRASNLAQVLEVLAATAAYDAPVAAIEHARW